VLLLVLTERRRCSLGGLLSLTRLDASRNFLRPNEQSLALEPVLRALPALRELNLAYNKKCDRESLRAMMQAELPALKLKLTISKELGAVPGAFVGNAPSKRDATLLRSQLEPWGTVLIYLLVDPQACAADAVDSSSACCSS